MEEALGVIEADPTTENALFAIRTVLQIANNWMRYEEKGFLGQQEGQALHDRLAALLLAHHVEHSGFLKAAFLYSDISPYQVRLAFDEQVYARLSPGAARDAMALRLVQDYEQGIKGGLTDDTGALRTRMRAFVQTVSRDHVSNNALTTYATRAANALDYSVGAKLPNITATTIDGAPDELARYKGNILLLDFWATWCGPCVQGQAELAKFKKEMAGQPFEIIGLSADSKPEAVRAHMKTHDMPWVNWHIGDSSRITYDWGIDSFPTYMVVDARGVIRARSNSFSEQLQEQIRTLTANP